MSCLSIIAQYKIDMLPINILFYCSFVIAAVLQDPFALCWRESIAFFSSCLLLTLMSSCFLSRTTWFTWQRNSWNSFRKAPWLSRCGVTDVQEMAGHFGSWTQCRQKHEHSETGTHTSIVFLRLFFLQRTMKMCTFLYLFSTMFYLGVGGKRQVMWSEPFQYTETK